MLTFANMNTPESLEAVRKTLREKREAAELSFAQLATKCGFKSASLLCEVEGGSRSCSFQLALALERELSIPVEEWGFDRATGRRINTAKAA